MKLPEPKYTVSDEGGKHKYTIKKGGETFGPLISVTKVLGIIAKEALIGWAAREAAAFFKAEILRYGKSLTAIDLDSIAEQAKNAHRRIAKDAADLGTAVHAACEAIINGLEPESTPNEIAEPVAAFKQYRLQSDIEVVATEIPVGSVNHMFGGRIDFVGYSKSRGGWGVGDIKTSSGFFGCEYALQVGGGYALALEEMYGIKIKWAEIVRFSKKPPYESEARPVTDLKTAQAGFLSALALLRVNNASLIGAPTFASNGNPNSAAKNVEKKKTATPLGF